MENSSGSYSGTIEHGDVRSPSYTPPAPPLVEQTRQKAGEVVDQARQQIRSQLASQKDRAAGGLGEVAEAFRQTGQQLRDHHQAAIGQYADQVADQVERLSGYLQGHEIDQLVGEVESLARRQPALFVGGAFMLGFFLTRFLKSSSDGGAAGTGARPAWDRSIWSSGTGMAAPAAMPAAGGMGMSHGAMSTSSGMAGSGATVPGSAPMADEEEADLVSTAGTTAFGGPTDDE